MKWIGPKNSGRHIRSLKIMLSMSMLSVKYQIFALINTIALFITGNFISNVALHQNIKKRKIFPYRRPLFMNYSKAVYKLSVQSTYVFGVCIFVWVKSLRVLFIIDQSAKCVLNQNTTDSH